MVNFQDDYNLIRKGKPGFYKHKRGLLEVSGEEAVQFLNGLITNDIAKLEDGGQMRAAFPTVKGRMFAVVRVMRIGAKFLFETEEATRQKIYDNLFRFTFAGDFHVEDVSDSHYFYTIFGDVEEPNVQSVIKFENDYAVPKKSAEEFEKFLGDAVKINDELYEVLRIENGIPKYGVDMDEETVVPEVGLDNMISYAKGCYIGQEVIARIHFRGKVAKKLVSLVFDDMSEPSESADGQAEELQNVDINSLDGKNAGKLTSVCYSPKLGKTIALAFIRNVYLEEGTELKVGGSIARVSNLPFV